MGTDIALPNGISSIRSWNIVAISAGLETFVVSFASGEDLVLANWPSCCETNTFAYDAGFDAAVGAEFLGLSFVRDDQDDVEADRARVALETSNGTFTALSVSGGCDYPPFAFGADLVPASPAWTDAPVGTLRRGTVAVRPGTSVLSSNRDITVSADAANGARITLRIARVHKAAFEHRVEPLFETGCALEVEGTWENGADGLVLIVSSWNVPSPAHETIDA